MSTIAAKPVVAAPSHRRWRRRLLVLLLILIGLPAGYYFYTKWSLEADIARAIAETDALDPRWRFDDMEADRKDIADEDNSALQIIKIAQSLRPATPRTPGDHKHYGEAFADLTPTAQLNSQQIQLIRDIFETIPNALTEARKLKNMPRGRFAVTWDPSGFLMILNDHQDIHTIRDLLQHDAMLKAQFGDPDAALESCLAQLNVARSLADSPFIYGLMIRSACDLALVQSVERILAQGQPNDEPLRHLQESLRTEQGELRGQWITALRSERAEFHRFFEPLQKGQKRWLQLAESLRMRVTLQDQLAHYVPSLMMKEYPQHLRLRNEQVAAARLPLDQQLEQFATLDQRIDRSDRRKVDLAEILPLLPRDLVNVCLNNLRGHAWLGAAEAGLACERYRLMHHQWPQSLAELVKAKLLDAVPTDPFDGQPLRLVRRKDGLTVYSVGPDKTDDGGNLQRDRPNEPGADLGFRLWDPQQRRQPPRPPAALDK